MVSPPPSPQLTGGGSDDPKTAQEKSTADASGAGSPDLASTQRDGTGDGPKDSKAQENPPVAAHPSNTGPGMKPEADVSKQLFRAVNKLEWELEEILGGGMQEIPEKIGEQIEKLRKLGQQVKDQSAG